MGSEMCIRDSNTKITIEVTGASKAALKIVEKAGGKVVVLEASPAPEKPSNLVKAKKEAVAAAEDNKASDESED